MSKKAPRQISDIVNELAETVSAMVQDAENGMATILQDCADVNAIIKQRMLRNFTENRAAAMIALTGGPATLEPSVPKFGTIRVGRIRGRMEPGKKYPVTEGYLNVVVTSHNQTKLGHSLSPYVLADSRGRIMENLWQFAKIYPRVTKQTQPDWTWETEVHCVAPPTGPALAKAIGSEQKPKVKPTDEYWEWRQTGMEHDKPIRYPNGFKGKADCICVLWPASGALDDATNPHAPMLQLGYVDSRKKVYVGLYAMMAKKNAEFAQLRKMLEEGQNLQILDVDGPDIDRATKNGVVKAPYDQIPSGVHGETSGVGSIEINEANIRALIEDTDQPFGHGYVLAALLLGGDSWMH